MDRDGVLWIATGGAGVRRRTNLTAEDTLFGEESGLPGTILTLEQDTRGNIWAGGFEGVYRYAYGRWSHRFGSGQLVSPVVTDLLSEADGIWIGTEGGFTTTGWTRSNWLRSPRLRDISWKRWPLIQTDASGLAPMKVASSSVNWTAHGPNT
ncbi:MAG: hypothetical protein HC802_19675 [Caldilineaceae bacterium]|nr:hypothetical protein [Caldilineaceae bacterium]